MQPWQASVFRGRFWNLLHGRLWVKAKKGRHLARHHLVAQPFLCSWRVKYWSSNDQWFLILCPLDVSGWGWWCYLHRCGPKYDHRPTHVPQLVPQWIAVVTMRHLCSQLATGSIFLLQPGPILGTTSSRWTGMDIPAGCSTHVFTNPH
jgi:hypothetical protein